MKINDRDKSILQYIVRHCNRVNEDVEKYGNTYKSFCSNNTFKDSVSMNLLQIGELTGRLSDDFKDNTQSQIPWKQIRSMRNLFAHDYGNMSTNKIWEAASEDVPVLLSFCEKQLKSFDQEKSTSNLPQADSPDDAEKTNKQDRESLDSRLARVRQTKEVPASQTQTQEQTKKPKKNEESLD